MDELDTVVLTRSLSEHGLIAGDVGAVVHVHEAGKAFEVEFVNGSGETRALVTLLASDLRTLAPAEILHVRAIA